MKKIILAFDKFKGSASSRQLSEAARQAIQAWDPAVKVVSVPVADGGEGTVEAIASTMVHAHFVDIEVPGPLMAPPPVRTRYAIDEASATAVMEMSAASGLALLQNSMRNVMLASTWGTGLMVRDAIDRGCHNIVMGLGGSATHDCATGLLAALGFEFLDEKGRHVLPCGRNLGKIAQVDDTGVPDEVMQTHFTLFCDVKNPLCGPCGAAHVYAPQKGANIEQVELLERGSMSFSRFMPVEVPLFPGAGAAGGMGAGMKAFLHAELNLGVEAVLEFLQFDKQIAGADVIFTGEGKIDAQTVMGKAPAGVLKAGRRQGIPVIALCGVLDADVEVEKMGFTAVFPIAPPHTPLDEAMKTDVCLQNLQNTLTHVLQKQWQNRT